MTSVAHPSNRLRWVAAVVSIALVAVGCSGGDDPGAATGTTRTVQPDADQQFPDVLEAVAEAGPDDGVYDFVVTISSPYDTPERYADGWRILGPDGTVYGEHELTHDHAGEQPFTRTQRGVAVPADVDEVSVEARDSQNGYGGGTTTVTLPD